MRLGVNAAAVGRVEVGGGRRIGAGERPVVANVGPQSAGTRLAGGKHRPDIGPLFYEPTVLSGVTPALECFDNETFGPVVSLYPVETEQEAIAKANDSSYGLNFAVWTSDPARSSSVLRWGT